MRHSPVDVWIHQHDSQSTGKDGRDQSIQTLLFIAGETEAQTSAICSHKQVRSELLEPRTPCWIKG